MVILKNIKKTQNDISADYYIEGTEPRGFMKVRISDGEIVEHENGGYGSSHVMNELMRLGKMENPPTEKTVVWY